MRVWMFPESRARRTPPIRTCVGCGTRDVQETLMRFMLGGDGSLVPGSGQGRGGYIHRRPQCVRAFTAARSGFVRSLRVVVPREIRERYAALVEVQREVVSLTK